MAALRKATSYSKRKARPFTRVSSKKNKAFIKTKPHNKIVKVVSGNQPDYEAGKHIFTLRMVSEQNVQIRDNSLEATRMFLTKAMDTGAPSQYFMRLMAYPHHILRENKKAAGAGADRLSSGMKHAYGINVGRAALVKPGQDLFIVTTLNEKSAQHAKKSMYMAKSKLPCKIRVVFERKNLPVSA